MSRCAIHGHRLPCVVCRARKTNDARPPKDAPDMFPGEAFPPDDPEPSPAAAPKKFNPQEMVEREIAARELHAQAMNMIAVSLAVYVEHTTGRKVLQ